MTLMGFIDLHARRRVIVCRQLTSLPLCTLVQVYDVTAVLSRGAVV